MTRRWLALLIGLAVGSLGCPDAPVETSREGTIINVEPGVIARGETRTIRIQGIDTDWAPGQIDTSNVSFGAELTVQNVTVENDRNIFAEVVADANATLGLREVQVETLTWANVFEVAEFVQISQVSALIQGGFFDVSLDGYRTEWSPSSTDVDLGTGVQISGQALGRLVFTDVVDKERIDIFGFVGVFTAPGPRSVTVSDKEERVLTDAIQVDAATITTLAENTQNSGLIPAANTSQLFAINSTFGRLIDIQLNNNNMTDAVGYLFSSAAGNVPVGRIVPGSPLSRIVVPTAGEQFILAVFDSQLGGGSGYDFQVRYDNTNLMPTTITAGMTMNQELGGGGDEQWWNFTTPARWQLATMTVTPTGGAPNIDAVITIARQGPEPLVVDAVTGTGAETATALVGTQMTTMFSVQDVDGNANGPNSAHDVDLAVAPLGSTIIESLDTFVPVRDPVALGSTAFTQSTLEVANSLVLGNLHVALDLAHPDVGNLVIDLQSPMGTLVRLHDGELPGQSGLLDAYLDLTQFSGENAMGTWTLHVGDTVPGNAGLIRGWAIATP